MFTSVTFPITVTWHFAFAVAAIDQEETLRKIQEILKKVAEIPGPEKAATAKADQGPEQTIVPWPKENDRYL